MRLRAPAGTFLFALLLPAAATARPRATFVSPPPERVRLAPAGAPASRLIYLNRCPGGCMVNPGYDDSVLNQSSIIDQPIYLSPFALGDQAWDDVVRCVKEIYRPFDVVITDEDPGTVPHYEALVAGSPTEGGFPDNYGGVAPYACGVIDNAVTYTFANVWSSSLEVCETVAQETAHGFGLDHELLCSDPMTYLFPCGRKMFQDQDADCGEDQPRQCYCGGSTQNSYQTLLSIFGEGEPAKVEIAEPADGATVPPGFRVSGGDAVVGVDQVELFIDGDFVDRGAVPPYIFRAPTGLAPGAHRIELRAYDSAGAAGTSEIEVTQARCGEGDCADGEACVSGRCILGPGMPGGLGERCSGNDDCASAMCGAEAGGTGVCAAPCEPAAGDCPAGFRCREASGASVCWPASAGGGCDAGGGAGVPLALLLSLGLLLRRKRPS